MTDAARTSHIVVGVDGSAPARSALRWALGQAEATGAVVQAVQAWDLPDSFGVAPTLQYSEDVAKAAESPPSSPKPAHPRVAGARPEVIRRGAPDRPRTPTCCRQSRGHGRFAGAVLGSVSQYCVVHATCPVVVVRGVDGPAE
jgi:nucleotide-binding universal stress UspA family protein